MGQINSANSSSACCILRQRYCHLDMGWLSKRDNSDANPRHFLLVPSAFQILKIHLSRHRLTLGGKHVLNTHIQRISFSRNSIDHSFCRSPSWQEEQSDTKPSRLLVIANTPRRKD